MTEHKHAALLIAALIAWPAWADDWTGPDKTRHLMIGAAVGASVTMATRNEWVGLAAAAGVGLAKEVYDAQHQTSHTVSGKDFAMTVLGGIVGAKIGGLVITPTHFIWSTSF